MNNTNIYIKKLHQGSMKTVVKIISPYQIIVISYANNDHAFCLPLYSQ